MADDFYTRPHRHIFTEMARLQESGSPIDLITLANRWNARGNSMRGWIAYLAELSKNTPSAANISAYADVVGERDCATDDLVSGKDAEAGLIQRGVQRRSAGPC